MQIPVELLFPAPAHRTAGYVDISAPGHEPIRLEIGDSPIILGRGESCDVQLELTNISREHARLARVREEFVIKDLGSTNGTFVNNVRVSRCRLHGGDQILIGEAHIVFTEHSKPEAL